MADACSCLKTAAGDRVCNSRVKTSDASCGSRVNFFRAAFGRRHVSELASPVSEVGLLRPARILVLVLQARFSVCQSPPATTTAKTFCLRRRFCLLLPYRAAF